MAAAERGPLELAAGLLAAAVALFAVHCWTGKRVRKTAAWQNQLGDAATPASERAPQDYKTRATGMKVSRLQRMLDDLAEACGPDDQHPQGNNASASQKDALSNDHGLVAAAQDYDKQLEEEQRTVEAVLSIISNVRQTEVHRKLPHFYCVEKELQILEDNFRSISISITGFWRYGRDEPMADLLRLPLLELASTGGAGCLIPLSQGFVKDAVKTDACDFRGLDEDASAEAEEASDLALLGLRPLHGRDDVESAFRHRSRHFHRHGRCTNTRGFNRLTGARNRCLSRLAMPKLRAYGGGGDLVAHYLLMGTDPGESWYHEFAIGILDSAHRKTLMQRLQVLQWPVWDIPLTWGDDADLELGGLGSTASPWSSG